jgi:hypothetical protein
MNAPARKVPAQTWRLEFSSHAPGLRAHLTGRGCLPEVKDYWHEIAAEVRSRVSTSLLLVDELEGEPLAASEWKQLVESMKQQRFDEVRIAHVKPRGLQKVEYCEIYAKEAGLDARVFEDERAASLWLRYGAR